jgi:hypothetical protein
MALESAILLVHSVAHLPSMSQPADLVSLALELEPAKRGWYPMREELGTLANQPSTGPCNPSYAAMWLGPDTLEKQPAMQLCR